MKNKNANRIAFYNSKGGSGKSTGTAQVAGYLALKGKSMFLGKEGNEGFRILLIDADPSYNLSQSFAHKSPYKYYPHLMAEYIEKNKGRKISEMEWPSAKELIQLITPAYKGDMLKKGTDDVIRAREKIHIMPSRNNFTDRTIIDLEEGIERLMPDNVSPEEKLEYDKLRMQFFERFFAPLFGLYDFILIDAPGQNTGWIYINVITMSHYIVSPSEADIYSTSALAEVDSVINDARKYATHNITYLGLYFSRYNERRALDRSIVSQALSLPHYMKVAIKNLAIIPQLQGEGELIAFDPSSQKKFENKTNVFDDKKKPESIGAAYMYLAEKSKIDENVRYSFEDLTDEILKRIKMTLIKKARK